MCCYPHEAVFDRVMKKFKNGKAIMWKVMYFEKLPKPHVTSLRQTPIREGWQPRINVERYNEYSPEGYHVYLTRQMARKDIHLEPRPVIVRKRDFITAGFSSPDLLVGDTDSIQCVFRTYKFTSFRKGHKHASRKNHPRVH